jgi:poly-gamma-glutamate synthesis protein (capsule biosynthesis protein)
MSSDPGSVATLRAVGDVALIGSAARALGGAADADWPATASYLADADVTFVNFEMPIPRTAVEASSPDVSKELQGSPEALPAFLAARVDVAAIATNHIMDWGLPGLEQTVEQLRENGVAVVGAGRNLDESLDGVVLERRGIRIGFAAFTPAQRWTATASEPGAAPLTLENVKESLGRIGEADVRVISLHWGLEMSNYPTPEDRRLAEEIVDAGADLILGHHPHVIQGVERFGRGWVTYSMGNFIFDTSAGRVKRDCDPWDVRAGYAVDACLTADGVESLRAVPTFIGESGVGTLAAGDEKERIENFIETVSENIAEGSEGVWEHAGSRVVGHRMKVLRRSLKDGEFATVFKELRHIRLKHAKLLFGFLASRLSRRSE